MEQAIEKGIAREDAVQPEREEEEQKQSKANTTALKQTNRIGLVISQKPFVFIPCLVNSQM